MPPSSKLNFRSPGILLPHILKLDRGCISPFLSKVHAREQPPINLIKVLCLLYDLIFISFHFSCTGGDFSFLYCSCKPCIHSFIHLSLHPSIHSLTHSLTQYSLIHSIVRSLVPSFIHSFIHSSIYSFIHPSIYPFTYSPTHSFFHGEEF